MPVTPMFECDNPQCKVVGAPEWIPQLENPRSKKPPVPPYGWLVVQGTYIGCGPNATVTVCSNACLSPAWEHAVEEAYRKDRGE
jgi:hypothetical protein